MTKNLVIVESPAKAKTIGKYLGKDFNVKSCNGHIRDLAPNKMSINIEKNFEPEYLILEEKQKLVKDLKDAVSKASIVWLATDEDREGEAISWHLASVLGLDTATTRRIVFHEITNKAINEAIQTPRTINEHLVDAQQARRVLDRLVGFKLSPVLWQKVKPGLSAGRVQSVAVRLVVEREREIINFTTKEFFRVTADFTSAKDSKSSQIIQAELSRKFDDYESSRLFLNDCIGSIFTVDSIETKATKRYPAPPFTTSTLQQEAYRKLGFSVSQTMKIAQGLYEAGYITYMRTDSVKLSTFAIDAAKKEVIKQYGKEYSKTRNFETKTKSAQEAHEAIRPTSFEQLTIDASPQENKLYELIWKRTLASQMAEADLDKTTVKILVSQNANYFVATGEVIKFDGFLKLYTESSDDENNDNGDVILPPLTKGERLNLIKSLAQERFTRPAARYTEASLVKKMEELGIGRPSTYAPTISTIQKREYVIKDTRPGKDRPARILTLENNQISESVKNESFGGEKQKMFPTNIGMMVNDFLLLNFETIVDFNFTATVEDKFDEVAAGNIGWRQMISEFYKDFDLTLSKSFKSFAKSPGERLLGVDPKTNQNVFVKMGKFGPFVQLGEKTPEYLPKFANLKKGQLLESITFEEALDLLVLPKELGLYEETPVLVNTGKFGPYVLHNKSFYALPRNMDPLDVDLPTAIDIIIRKKDQKEKSVINTFDYQSKQIVVLKGRFGPYISFNRKSFKIPKGTVPEDIDLAKAIEIIQQTTPSRKRFTKSKAK